MDKETVTEVIAYLRSELQRRGIRVDAVALFGSCLSGGETCDSDIDLILICDSFNDKNIFERGDLTMDAELSTLRQFKVPLDILKMTRQEYQYSVDSKRIHAQVI